MFVRKLLLTCLSAVWLVSASSQTETGLTVSHLDPIKIDSELSLSDLVAATLERYPDSNWLAALEEEAKAIKRRGESWFAGAPSLSLAYQEATSGTLHYGDAVVGAPLWNFGQRDAEQTVAQHARKSAQSQKDLIRLRVTGLLRIALWDMALMNIRHEQARTEYAITQRLVAKIKKLYQLGELPKADLLLVQTELLQKRSILTQAEAEVMHARKRYISIAQTHSAPEHFQESQVKLSEIELSHPVLQAVNGLIDRKRAEIEVIRLAGPGQTTLSVGVNSDHGDSRSNRTESFNIAVNMPFGGSAHLAPKIAAANVELNKLIAHRVRLFRDLELGHHEAEHSLQVNQTELEIANELKQIAEQHMKMTELSFSAGEINLIDFLKILSRTQHAILNAKERSIALRRDIALYNQSVGVMP